MYEFVSSIVQNIQIHANEILTYFDTNCYVQIPLFYVKNIQIRINKIVTCQQKTYSYVRIRNFYRTKYTNSCK